MIIIVLQFGSDITEDTSFNETHAFYVRGIQIPDARSWWPINIEQ